jgi:predicted GIY-YIG superfamily endonuclease
MSFYVYWIREQSHTDMMTQGYIGVSGNVEQRFASHKGMWSGTNNHLRNAIKKHGWDNLVKSVLLIAEKDYCLDIERKLRPAEQIGWNLTIGGGYPPVIFGPRPKLKGRPSWNKGRTGVYSASALAKMRQSHLGQVPANKGIPHTAETKAKLSALLTGKPGPRTGVKVPRELVERIAAKLRGRIQSPEERAMRSAMLKGIKKTVPRSDEHRAKLGLLAKGKRWYNDGATSIFCYEDTVPDGFVAGRIAPWLSKKEAKIV